MVHFNLMLRYIEYSSVSNYFHGHSVIVVVGEQT